ncbi:hypothetical protein AKJ57_04340 [candidate division MSBL1 archaeon SCGC-AAA259A05]|uniref:Uncharacterized protein n=1 Tax=candidate division MSBL1 archaeon SCGC-AAA259A05 TaxID=1698259 RepID=A0A133U7N9_9EURY|nr:hypothetical protein AKJ57_04340 [candidate division MSBL1 archaeon SCGC-AAA259A05]
MKNDSMPELSLSKTGTWKDVVELSEDIGSLLKSVEPEDVNGEISKDEFEALSREWQEWRPQAGDNFSREMREKTAKKSSIEKSEFEKKERDAKKEAKNAGKSMVKAAKDSRKKKLGKTANHIADAVESAGRALDCKVRQGARSLEEKIYENIILKANSLYFDNNVLDAVVSKKWRRNSSNKYQLTLHSNNPHLRKFFAKRIDWDDC